MIAVRNRLDELGDNTIVALLTFTEPENLVGYSATHDLPFPILIDPDRRAYRAFGLARGSLARVYGWKVARRYLELFRQQGMSGLARPTEDTLQLGGDFVVGSDGTLVYGFWGEGPDDRPSVDDLIEAVQGSRTGPNPA